jgi:hypothetical protein
MHGTVSASARGACRNVHRLLRPRQSRLTISTESSKTGRQIGHFVAREELLARVGARPSAHRMMLLLQFGSSLRWAC